MVPSTPLLWPSGAHGRTTSMVCGGGGEPSFDPHLRGSQKP